MKKLLTLFALAVLAVTVGCAGQKPLTAKLPVGAINSTDAATYRVLNDAHAFLQSVHDSVASGAMALTATQKMIFNSLVASSNAADALWQQYHVGLTTDPTQLNAAAAKLQSDLNAAQGQIVGVSK